jgi:stress-induced morphogen
MTKQEIRDAIEFLQKVFVGQSDVDRLEAVIQALQTELARRNKK